jgi:hypothetical protein
LWVFRGSFADPIRQPPSPRSDACGTMIHAASQTTRTRSNPMPRAAQRMPPVDTARFPRLKMQIVQMPMFLPQFVGEKKRDDE